MKLELVMADPAGNRTALVLTPVPPESRAGTARRLMALPELRAEQVGYCCPPRAGGMARLEMMGGEFCGNAARSFGLLLAAQRGLGRSTVPVEVSGCPQVLPVAADPGEGSAFSPMPLPLEITGLPVPGLGTLPAVLLEGIVHVVARGVPPSGEEFRWVRRAADSRWNWDALGVLFLGEDGFLAPAVAVRATGSTVFESSCASGSAALAAWLSRDRGDGVWDYRFPQPGGVISARAERTGGRLCSVTVGGPVSLEPPRTVEAGPFYET